jgi:NRAMP (natural resistance-associated macrophage protein)-like metal ion transporter
MSISATSRREGGTGAEVIHAPFGLPAERRSVLDPAHLGTLAALMGPGLIVMVADNDAGGVSVYAQAGQDYGLRLLWPLLLLAPVLFVNQEMVARLGAVTGAGHARLIFERFGRRWGWFALGDLLLLNVLTVVTELIGVRLACDYFGISRFVCVPLAAAALILLTVTGSFRRWERAMYLLVAVNLVGIPLVFLNHRGGTASLQPASHVLGGGFVLFAVALVGTTVAPWQFFFHQSNVVDKRITARWLAYERLDTLAGTALFAFGAVAVLAVCAFAFSGTPPSRRFHRRRRSGSRPRRSARRSGRCVVRAWPTQRVTARIGHRGLGISVRHR